MRIIIGFLLIIITTTGHGQDSLVYFNELVYTSNLEKEAFQQYATESKTDPFILLCGIGGQLNDSRIRDSRARFYTYLQSLEAKLTGKKPEKRIKFIYDNIHAEFFKKFVKQSVFEDLFYNGNYNDVSASALYGLAFEYLKIPYAIKETAEQVYLVAFPGAGDYQVKATDVGGGYLELNQTFKQNFVKSLKDQKIISASEFASQSTNSLFDAHYFGKQGEITLTELAGIQYLNDAFYLSENQQHEKAYHQVEKAYYLYPSQRSAYLLLVTGSQALEHRTKKDADHARLVGRLSRYREQGVTPEMIVGEFSQVIQTFSDDVTQRDNLVKYYQTLTPLIQDSSIVAEIRFIYQFETGRWYARQNNFRQATAAFEKSLAAKPTNLDALNALTACLLKVASDGSSNENELTKKMESYQSTYPALMNNNYFVSLLASLYLVQFGSGYDAGQPAEGARYQGLFENLRNTHEDIEFNHGILGKAYSAAAVYYFRKGQKEKARALINQGLKYSPGNRELLIRQQMIR